MDWLVDFVKKFSNNSLVKDSRNVRRTLQIESLEEISAIILFSELITHTEFPIINPFEFYLHIIKMIKLKQKKNSSLNYPSKNFRETLKCFFLFQQLNYLTNHPNPNQKYIQTKWKFDWNDNILVLLIAGTNDRKQDPHTSNRKFPEYRFVCSFR